VVLDFAVVLAVVAVVVAGYNDNEKYIRIVQKINM